MAGTFDALRARAFDRTPLGSAQFRAVIGASLFIMIGFGLIVPALPLFAKRFGVEEAGIGLVLFVFNATRLVGDFFAGGLIDRYGERAMTAIGAVIVGLSSVAAGAAPNFAGLVLLRGAGGIGSAFFLGGLMAYLIGTVPADERGRAMSIFQASVGVGLLVGPLAGGLVIATASVNTPLYLYGAVCIASAPILVRVMGPVRIPSEALAEAPAIAEGVPGPAGRAWHRMRPLLRSSTYRGALAASAIGFLVTGALQTLMPVFWTGALGGSKATTGVPFTVMALTGIAVVWHAGALSDRRGRKFALVPALAASALAIAALGLTENAPAIVLIMAVLGATSGYGRPGPTAMIADVAPPEARGVAVSGYRIAGDIGALIGPMMAGVLAQTAGFRAAFLAVAACTAAAFVVTLLAEESAPARPARASA